MVTLRIQDGGQRSADRFNTISVLLKLSRLLEINERNLLKEVFSIACRSN